MNSKVFLINLDKSTDRLQNCQRILKTVDVVAERVSAVYGADLSEEELSEAYSYEIAGAYHKQLNPGEIGCYLSHRKAWETIVEQKLDFAIVLEDDFELCGDLTAAVTAVTRINKPWDYIKLAGSDRKRSTTCNTVINDFELVRYQKIPARTCAQAVSLAGAKKLLQHSRPFKRPVDIDIQFWWEKSLDVYGLIPYPMRAREDTASEIDKLARRSKSRQSIFKKLSNMLYFAWHNRRAIKSYKVQGRKRKLDA